ncbi:hypothetical protein F8M41_020411 [Gigaspora margarita]|uniref:Uncharacterized protein n=1 Tax=Gigaspora margarita TaxID=4874 RepID=A0A8H4B1Z7_GIGMA|nr:hypothetical protein F8M41_020411 [Gigaspora margarita]
MTDQIANLETQRTDESPPPRTARCYTYCRNVLIGILSCLRYRSVQLYRKVTAKHIDENKNLTDESNIQIVKLQEEIELLKQKNNSLRDEASNYQVLLSSMTSYRLADDDQNNSVYLTEDINKLYDRISKFVTNLKKGVNLHKNEVSVLMQKYDITTKGLEIQLVKEVLKRLVIDTIINMADTYFKSDKSDNFQLEKDIINPLSSLLNNFHKLSNERSGSSDIIKAVPTKVRQQMYMVLGNLAFSNIIYEEEKILEHPFISNSKKELINTINQYRTINDDSKRKEIENQVSALIRDVISIFYFRRYIQEPIVEYTWIENNKPIDPLTMDGIWNDDIGDLVVKFCSFPLFGTELENLDKMKIYTRARVIT